MAAQRPWLVHKPAPGAPAAIAQWRPVQLSPQHQQQLTGRRRLRRPSCSSASSPMQQPGGSSSGGSASSSSRDGSGSSGSSSSSSSGSSLSAVAQQWAGFRGTTASGSTAGAGRRRASQPGPVPVACRPADTSDYWAVADLHACAFYPRASFFWFAALRIDRVMSLQLGKERQADGVGRFACLVAEGRSSLWGRSSSSSGSSSSSDSGSDSAAGEEADVATALSAATPSSSGSSSSKGGLVPPPCLPGPVAASQAAAAAEGRVDLGPLVDWFVGLFWPAYLRVNYASSYAGGSLLGAVTIDTMGEFVPPKRKRMPNGTIREVPRPKIAYLSNLAVAPCTRRAGVGARLLQEAEATAASWGCRSMALHVDPSNTAAVQMYTRAGYRKVLDQPEWQRLLEQRAHPLALYMRPLPWEARQAAKAAAAQAAEEPPAAEGQQAVGADAGSSA